MKGTPDRRRISSYSAINYSYPCFPVHKYHTSRSYDKQAREQEQILVINCQSDAAGGDIVRIRWMYSQFSAAGPDGTQIFSAPPPDQSSCAHRVAPALPAGFPYPVNVCSGLLASLFLVSIPATSEIHAAALLCLLRGAQRWV